MINRSQLVISSIIYNKIKELYGTSELRETQEIAGVDFIVSELLPDNRDYIEVPKIW